MAVNEKIRIKIKGYEHATVDAAAAKIVEAAKRSGARVSEMRTHKRLIDVIRPTAKTTDALQKLEVPAGVDIVMELK